MPRAKTVGFAISVDLLPDLDLVVNEYAGGNRSEFLRLAVRKFRAQMMAERLTSLRAQAAAERGGKTYTAEDVRALVAKSRQQ